MSLFYHFSLRFYSWRTITVHPNCRHALRPVGIWHELPEEQKKALLEEAKKPFDVDPRSEAEIRAYNAQQEKNRKRNADLNQYRQYRVVLSNDMPTFSGWRRMKAANSERYQMIRLDFQRRNRLLQDSSLALPGAESATAADAKFTKYLFYPTSANGWPKGVAFDRRLGYNIDNWQELRTEILRRAPMYPVTERHRDAYGQRYEQKIVLPGLKGRPANVVVGWIVDENGLHMTTLIVKEV